MHYFHYWYKPECVLSLADMNSCWTVGGGIQWIAPPFSVIHEKLEDLANSMSSYYKFTIILNCHVASLIYTTCTCMHAWLTKVFRANQALLHACMYVYVSMAHYGSNLCAIFTAESVGWSVAQSITALTLVMTLQTFYWSFLNLNRGDLLLVFSSVSQSSLLLSSVSS